MATDVDSSTYSAPPPEASAALAGEPPDPVSGGGSYTPAPAPILPRTDNGPSIPVVAQPPAAQPHTGVLASILGAVGDVLGGPKSVKSVDPKTGDIIDQPLTGRERIANTAAMYLRGIGAGLAAHGPGAAGQAFIMGGQAEQQHEQQAMEQNQQQSQNIRQELNDQASRAHLAQLNAESSMRLTRDQTEIDAQTADKLEKYRSLIASNPSNKDWGTYKSLDDFIAAHKDFQQNGVSLLQMQAKGELAAVPVTEAGKITGFRVFQVNPEWADQLNDKEEKFLYPTGKMIDDGKGNKTPEMKEETIPAHAIKNGTLMQFLGTQGNEALGAAEKTAKTAESQQKTKESQELLPSQKAEAAANVAAKQASAQKDLAEAKALGTDDFSAPDSTGTKVDLPTGGVKEYNKRLNSFKKDIDALAQTEASYQQFHDIINDISAGKDLTGAQSVVALFNAIGLSVEPLRGKGMRINNPVIEEHIHARGLPQEITQKILKLKKGDIITPQQVKDYAKIADEVRVNQYVNKINEMHAMGVKADPALGLLKGNGNSIYSDPGVAKILLKVTGDPAKARQAAIDLGWQVPQQAQ